MSEDNSSKKNFIQSPSPNWRLKVWHPLLTDEIHLKLKKFFLELLKFNKTINLISPKTVLNADAIHFSDSIETCQIVSKLVNKNNLLYDFGSGNGFPGLVYSILYPDQNVCLVDSDERKCEFLKHVINFLDLKNTSVQNVLIESFLSDSVDQAICRGFAPLPKSLLMLRKIVKKGGVVFHMKSEEWAIEVSQIPIQVCSIWQPALVSSYLLPINSIKMFIVKTDKID